MPPEETQRALTAEFSEEEDSMVFTHTLVPLPSNPTTEEKTAYLASLRSSVGKLQAEVNAFLTKKMEDEKNASIGASVEAQKEEDNYGEEDAEAS